MTMTLISHKRYCELDQIISFFLTRFPSDILPIKITEMLKQLSLEGVYFNTFKQFAQTNDIPLALVSRQLKTNNACLKYDKNTGNAYIYYNQDLPKNTKRWDLTHEIGHHTLGHYKIVEADSGYLNEQDLKRFEEEANYFAKQVLAPDSLAIAVMAHWGRFDFPFLYMLYRTLFQLGRQASLYCAWHMEKFYLYKKVNKKLIQQYAVPLVKYFNELSDETRFSQLWLYHSLELQNYARKNSLNSVAEIMDKLTNHSGFYFAPANSVM